MAKTKYPVNSIKKDPSGSGAFAIRTSFDDEREWRVVGLNSMAHYVPHEDVADWTDMQEVNTSER